MLTELEATHAASHAYYSRQLTAPIDAADVACRDAETGTALAACPLPPTPCSLPPTPHPLSPAPYTRNPELQPRFDATIRLLLLLFLLHTPPLPSTDKPQGSKQRWLVCVPCSGNHVTPNLLLHSPAAPTSNRCVLLAGVGRYRRGCSGGEVGGRG